MTSNGAHGGNGSGRSSKEGEGKRQRKSGQLSISEDDKTLLQHNSWLKGLPLLTPSMCEPDAEPNLANITDKIAKMWKSDFCWGSCFEPSFLAALMYEGFLPTAHGGMDGPKEFVLLPKLHLERCLVHFEDLHIRKSWRRQAKNFTMSIDCLFDQVVDKCLEQHGESWLHPPIVDGFKRLFHSGGVGPVRMHSVELYKDGELVAGELGFSAGTSYCSLSGFSSASCAGSVQCVALAVHLHRRGMDMWDLGMGMAYKHTMGAKDVPRLKFLGELKAARDKPVQHLALDSCSTGDLLLPRLPVGEYVEVLRSYAQHGGRVGRVVGQAGAWVRVRFDSADGGEGEGECVPPEALRLLFLAERADGELPWSLRGGGGAGRKRRRRRGGTRDGESAGSSAAAAGGDTVMSEGEGGGGARSGRSGEKGGREGAEWEQKVGHHREWEQRLARRRRLRQHLEQSLREREGKGKVSKRGARRLRKIVGNAERRAHKAAGGPTASGGEGGG